MAHSRRKILLLIITLHFLASCGGGGGGGGGGNSNPRDEPPAQEQPDNTVEQSPEPRPDPDTVSVERIRIAWGQGDQQFGVLYRPENATRKLPVVIMIHGGCWFSPYRLSLQTDLSIALAKQSFAVWNIEFRRIGNGGDWPVIFQDVAAAAEFLRTIAGDYNLDLNAVTAMGHSSGGHLALWLAGHKSVGAASPIYRSRPLSIHGVVGLGPITDLQSPICDSIVPRLIALESLDDEALKKRLADTSPIDMLPIGIASIIYSGSEDTISPASIAQTYVDAAVLAGDFSEHLVIEGADHFDLIDSAFMDMNLLADSIDRVRYRTQLK
jgi:acetyl esterase/lipase